ncbi:TIGR02444 family protein [Halopseudomonas maritima]|uniref:TIGR02444 family protein n=1 Tax=Halopseudomonas maritima TaxID=2918528 RepID=UPI001EEC2022|nr:TIGR02444 family protein [Halopseudomonas maritima]UJJ30222.1 TIGR02444 family protein [Halopseudomonas maritima]
MNEKGLARWSEQVYAREGVAPLLLALQDEAGEDVLLLLLAAWLQQQGRGLSVDVWQQVHAQQAQWRDALMLPLRQARRALAQQADLQAQYQQLKAIEIEVELARLSELEQVLAQGTPADEPMQAALTAACSGARTGRREQLLADLAPQLSSR